MLGRFIKRISWIGRWSGKIVGAIYIGLGTEILPLLRNWNPARRLHRAHHADVSQARLLTATASNIDGRIYNVADDAPISVAELLQLHNSESSAETLEQDFDLWDMIFDTTRIRDELHYRPIYPSFYSARDAGVL